MVETDLRRGDSFPCIHTVESLPHACPVSGTTALGKILRNSVEHWLRDLGSHEGGLFTKIR